MTELKQYELDQASINFVESFGQIVSEGGLPPSIGKVLGLLVIHEPNVLSAEQIKTILKISTGSVSSATSLLTRFGYIKKVTRPGQRQYLYEFEASSWQYAVNSRLESVKKGIALAEQGLKIRRNDPRLVGMLSLYQQIYSSLKDIQIST